MEIPLNRTVTFRVLQRELAPFEVRNEPWQQNCRDHNAKAKSYGKTPFIKAFQRIKVAHTVLSLSIYSPFLFLTISRARYEVEIKSSLSAIIDMSFVFCLLIEFRRKT